jgi:hypothetical protein
VLCTSLKIPGLEEAQLTSLLHSHFCNAASENCNGPDNLLTSKNIGTLIREALKRSEERGSPSLVGRGIANPMSERTRGFELPSEDGDGTIIPLPALLIFPIFSGIADG